LNFHFGLAVSTSTVHEELHWW